MKIIANKLILPWLFLLGLLLSVRPLKAQDSLSHYLALGLQNNLVVMQKVTEVNKASFALRIAKSYFMPNVQFNTLVSTAEGGRYADLPLGDMLNGVYSTLNQLTSTQSFPQIQNQTIHFLPKNYYESYVRTSMPLYNPAIREGRNIEQGNAKVRQAELDVYKRELVMNIKQAYYDYLSALKGVEIYKQALEILEKNLQVNQSLYNNGKVLQANVLRSMSELENTKAGLAEMVNKVDNARAYFNFLLNRPLQAYVHNEPGFDTKKMINAIDTNSVLQKREELEMVDAYGDIRQSLLKLNTVAARPTVNAFLDLGSQATDFEVSRKSLYYMVGVNLSVPIYSGSRVHYKVSQSRLDCEVNELQKQQTENGIQLGIKIAANGLRTSMVTYQASLAALKSAESYFAMIDRGYKEGIHSLIEYIDARNQYTNARLKLELSAYNVLKAEAELERNKGTFQF